MRKETKLYKYGTLRPSFGQRLKFTLKSLFGGSGWMYNSHSFYNTGFSLVNWNKQKGVTKGFNANQVVYSIISKIAKTCSYAQWGSYKVIDSGAYDEYMGLSKQQLQVKDIGSLLRLKTKALQRIHDDRLEHLLKYPNKEQSASEYMENLIGYKLLTGDFYEWSRLIPSGENEGKPLDFHCLPSQYMMIDIHKGSFPIEIDQYRLENGDKTIVFDPKEILHGRYFNPNFDFNGNHLYGFSPLQAGWLALLQDNESRDAGIEILQNRGVRGVLSIKNDAMRTQKMANEQAGLLKERWKQESYENRGGLVLTPGVASWTKVGLSLDDMKILEIGEYTLDDLCNIYGVSSVLFNSRTNSKYDNFEQARKDFIINSILPILNQYKDARNQKLFQDWGYGGSGIVIDYDVSGFVELQQDLAKQSEWLNRSWWLTPNERRSYMRELPLQDEDMDKVYIPNDLIPINEQNLLGSAGIE